MFFGALMVIAAGLAVAPPAHALGTIVKLTSVQNSKCLQPVNHSGLQGDAVVQMACDGSLYQQWEELSSSSTTLRLRNRGSGLCLDARGGPVNGTPIQQWTCNGISNEKWTYGITNNLLGSAVSGSFSHCIASPGSQDGLPMELRFCDGNPAQLWTHAAG
jgi:hypothetical protein